jgi:glyoxylase-like metal-dependent hydrolase (beta-lactamase superfamily II)
MPTLNLPLEDNFGDIIGKAMRGLKISREELAERTGVSEESIARMLEGNFDQGAARAVAPALELSPTALMEAGQKSYRPAPIELEGLAQFNTVYEDMTVNSYLVWDPATKEAVAFDTGTDVDGMLNLIGEKGLKLVAILLTHTHGDHVYDLDRLREKTGAPAYVGHHEPLQGAESFHAGREFRCGELTIDSRLTWGHSPGGITYIVSGLARPVAVVGDAVFAGSMGGGGISYEDALFTNKKEIFALPNETIICPGHGPLTTVGEELKHNPFYAK